MPSELPDPPWRVLAIIKECESPQWWTVFSPWHFAECQTGQRARRHRELVSDLEVIPHPRNDPEAVKIIEQSKEGKDADAHSANSESVPISEPVAEKVRAILKDRGFPGY